MQLRVEVIKKDKYQKPTGIIDIEKLNVFLKKLENLIKKHLKEDEVIQVSVSKE